MKQHEGDLGALSGANPEQKHTPGPWWFRMFHGTPEDLAAQKRLGMTPVPALDNDGSRFIMSGFGDDVKRVALVDCQTRHKRGQGHKTDCAERDANARLIASAPDLLEACDQALATLTDRSNYQRLVETRETLRAALSKARATGAELSSGSNDSTASK